MEDTFSLTGVKDSTPLPVTSQEEKELRRVYDQLCDYHRKKILKKELGELVDWQESTLSKIQQQQAAGIIVDMERFESTNAANQERIDQLRHEIAEIARENIDKLAIKNIELVTGDINNTLTVVLDQTNKLDFVFIDANHKSEAILNYFNLCLSKVHSNTVIVIDDIYWSSDMEKAWKKIKNSPQVMSTIDLFELGIVFFNPDLHKKHYKMRY